MDVLSRFSDQTDKENTPLVSFNRFCEQEGMEHQVIVACSYQQNGVAERKNKTDGDNQVHAQ